MTRWKALRTLESLDRWLESRGLDLDASPEQINMWLRGDFWGWAIVGVVTESVKGYHVGMKPGVPLTQVAIRWDHATSEQRAAALALRGANAAQATE